MRHIAVIGTGEVGSRHVQGLIDLPGEARIFAVDPSPASRELATERWNNRDDSGLTLTTHESVDSLPVAHLDLAILATTARTRRVAFENLVDTAAVENVLFEKVLFQDPAEYDEVGTILDRNDITAWVNCPRREYDGYQRLREAMDDGPVDISVTGTNWSLASNSIHFVDLLSWLTEGDTLNWDTSGLRDRIYESPREGFVELHGLLSATDSRQNSLSLRCFRDETMDLSVRIATPTQRWIIHEGIGQITRLYLDGSGRWNQEQSDFSTEYQSNLTGKVAGEIFDSGECELARFEESAQYHLPLIRHLIEHINAVEQTNRRRCPIT